MFPPISPLSPSQERPFWSVMIPTYNSTAYLEATLLSVLEQDPGVEKMQIEIVDDCSTTDNALETIHKMGLQDRVTYFRQSKNVGIAGNWNTCIERSKGEVVHILHQDDLVFPGFYQSMETAFHQEPDIGAVFCRHQFIDGNENIISTSPLERAEPGILPNWLEKIASLQHIQTPSITVRRSVYEKLGGFHPELLFVLDWEMWIRISNSFPVFYVPGIFAAYRSHNNAETARLRQSAQTIHDIPRSFVIRNQYLPLAIAGKSEKIARNYFARYAFRAAISFLENHMYRSCFMNISAGLRCDFTLSSITYIVQLMIFFILKYFHIYQVRVLNKPATSKGDNHTGSN